MALAGAVLKVELARRGKVVRELATIDGVSIELETQGELILLIEAANIGALHKVCSRLETLAGVLGVYPAYVTTADEQ